jgi:hypothetical protein
MYVYIYMSQNPCNIVSSCYVCTYCNMICWKEKNIQIQPLKERKRMPLTIVREKTNKQRWVTSKALHQFLHVSSVRSVETPLKSRLKHNFKAMRPQKKISDDQTRHLPKCIMQMVCFPPMPLRLLHALFNLPWASSDMSRCRDRFCSWKQNRLLGALKVTVERIDDAVLREWQVVV